jgi:hypothetical protein
LALPAAHLLNLIPDLFEQPFYAIELEVPAPEPSGDKKSGDKYEYVNYHAPDHRGYIETL